MFDSIEKRNQTKKMTINWKMFIELNINEMVVIHSIIEWSIFVINNIWLCVAAIQGIV